MFKPLIYGYMSLTLLSIRWGVAFPRQKIDVVRTSFWRRFFFYNISYPLSHTSFLDSLFILQQTIIKIDPSAACSAAHATQQPQHFL